MEPIESLDQLLRPSKRRDRLPPRWGVSASLFRRPALVALAVVAIAAVTAWSLWPTSSTTSTSLPRVGVGAVADGGTSGASEGSTGGAATTGAPRTGSTTTSLAEPTIWVVHVAGAVVSPGVVTVPAGSRVGDAITAAGGAAPGALLDAINLAEVLADGVRISVPAAGDPVVIAPGVTPASSGGGGSASGSPAGGLGGAGGAGGLVNLNTATVDELQTLPGVGPATAEAIIAYRSEHGPFSSPQALDDVRGIGPAKLEALVDLVTT